MVNALKTIVVPCLRKSGFTGSFPHFRRASDARVDLMTFQFDKWGGGFVIEISQCSSEGITTAWGKHIGPNKVSAWDLHPDRRFRLRPKDGASTDGWFRYESGDYETTARAVLPFLAQAEMWWQNRFDETRPNKSLDASRGSVFRMKSR